MYFDTVMLVDTQTLVDSLKVSNKKKQKKSFILINYASMNLTLVTTLCLWLVIVLCSLKNEMHIGSDY